MIMAYRDPEVGIERLLEKTASYRPQLEAWNAERKVNGFKGSTRLRGLASLKPFVASLDPRPLTAVTREGVRDYIGGMGGSPATIDRAKADIRAFLTWLAEQNGKRTRIRLQDAVKWLKVGLREVPYINPKDVLSREDIKALAEAAENPRNRAMAMVLYESGFRAGEFLSLNVGDAYFDSQGVRLVLPRDATNLKTGRREVTLIDAEPALSAWLEFHSRGTDPKAPLWESFDAHISRAKPRQRLSYTALSVILKGLAKRAQVAKRANAHAFRHSRASHMAEDGYNEAELRLFFGWSPVSRMPSRYVHYGAQALREKMLRRAGREPEGPTPRNPLEPEECPRCQERNDASARFCKRCGLNMMESGGWEVADISDMYVRLIHATEIITEHLQKHSTPEDAKAAAEAIMGAFDTLRKHLEGD